MGADMLDSAAEPRTLDERLDAIEAQQAQVLQAQQNTAVLVAAAAARVNGQLDQVDEVKERVLTTARIVGVAALGVFVVAVKVLDNLS